MLSVKPKIHNVKEMKETGGDMDAISLVNGAMARVLNEGYPRRPERPMTGVK
jgi:hypothetical protein